VVSLSNHERTLYKLRANGRGRADVERQPAGIESEIRARGKHMVDTTDVVIIGGGAAGCAVAYYLAEAGVRSVIVEREGIGSQASGFSAGGLNPLQGACIPGPLGSFAWESFQMHLALADQLKNKTGIDCQFRRVSQVRLAFEETEFPELQETIDIFSRVDGYEAGWLEPNDIQRLEPRVSRAAIRGIYEHGNAALDSLSFTQALIDSAVQSGSTVRAGAVLGLDAQGGNVVRVLLEDGALECGQVVMALGPWSRKAESWLDTYIPVDPLKGEILRMELPGQALGHDIAGGGGNIYTKPDGLAWCGTTEEWRGFDRQPLEETRRGILERVTRIVPDMANAKLVLHTACLRPVTPDWLPILGRAPGYENVFLATGAGKKGILLAPAIGKSIADLITDGTTALPITGFGPDRFVS
jgi:glycine oxidase